MPEDTSPHGGEAFHEPPARARIPDPPQGAASLSGERSDTAERPGPQTMAGRPALPEHPQSMAADLEDEDADPVVDTGPGLEDPGDRGVVSVTRQPGG